MSNPAQENPNSTFSARLSVLLRKHGITLLLLAAIAYLWFRPPATVTPVNRTAGEWSVQLTDGRTIRSSELKGKVVLVNFWATWCPYCRKEKPVINAFWNDHRQQGFEVLSISVDDTPEQVRAYMQENDYRFMAGVMNDELRAVFGSPSKIPASFVLDKNGVITHKVSGQLHYKRLETLTGIQ